MRAILSIAALLVVVFGASAQEPEAGDVRIESDSAVMDILDSYRHILPPRKFDRGSWYIRSWTPHVGLMPQRLLGTEYHLWAETQMMPRVEVKAPRFLDYNSVTLRLGSSSSSTITISNGSAYNHMPWPNSPQAYRDARTLSFPLPR